MKYNININQKPCVDNGISLKASILLDLFSELSSWASAQVFSDGVYYYLAYSKILIELPLVFSKKDTVYRFVKELKEKGLIEQCKKGTTQQNFIRLSKKGKAMLRVGKKSEPFIGSEKNPSRVGKKSEPLKTALDPIKPKDSVQGSEKNPTYNNNNTKDNIYIDFSAISFIIENAKDRFQVWEMQNKKTIPNFIDFLKFFEIKVEEEEIEFNVNKLLGRLKRLAFNWNTSSKTNGYSTTSSNPLIKPKRLN